MINKFFKNDDAVGHEFVIFIFASLLISTCLIGYFLLSIYGINAAGYPIEYPEGEQNYLSAQNFSTNQINDTTIQTTRGIWEYQSGIGKVLVQKGIPLTEWSYLYIRNIQKDDKGYITNYYTINNSVKQPYSIVIKYTQSSSITELTIDENGIYVPEYILNQVVGKTHLLDYAGMDKVENVEIKTRWKEETGDLDFTFNGQTWNFYGFGKYTKIEPLKIYGGVASNTVGFTLTDFHSDNKIAYNADTDVTAQLSALLVIMFKLVIFNVEEMYLPFELNLILIKTQTVALLIAIIAMVRG